MTTPKEQWKQSFLKRYPMGTFHLEEDRKSIETFIEQTRAEAEIAGEAKGRLMGFEVGHKAGLEEARRVVEKNLPDFMTEEQRDKYHCEGSILFWGEALVKELTNRIEEN
jgi:hypothetical protein